jgi:hypothetical protein
MFWGPEHAGIPSSLRGALATKQSSFVPAAYGLLRFARNDGYGNIVHPNSLNRKILLAVA